MESRLIVSACCIYRTSKGSLGEYDANYDEGCQHKEYGNRDACYISKTEYRKAVRKISYRLSFTDQVAGASEGYLHSKGHDEGRDAGP